MAYYEGLVNYDDTVIYYSTVFDKDENSISPKEPSPKFGWQLLALIALILVVASFLG